MIRTLAVTVALSNAAGLAAGCGSDDDASTTTAAATTVFATSLPAPTIGVTPVPSIEPVADAAHISALLPDLVPSVDSGTHVIELQLRTLEVSVDDGQLCLGSGDRAAADSCAVVASGPGIVAYSDASEITPVYAVLTANDVAVEFTSVGSLLSCYSEPATRLGAMTVSWCEDQDPDAMFVTAPDGRRFEVTIG